MERGSECRGVVQCDQHNMNRCWSARRIVCDLSETAAAACHRRCSVHLQTCGWLSSQEFVDQLCHLFSTQVVVAYGMTEARTRCSASTEHRRECSRKQRTMSAVRLEDACFIVRSRATSALMALLFQATQLVCANPVGAPKPSSAPSAIKG